MGWTAPQVASLSGVPTRTIQEWRKTGFFVPALPDDVTEHPGGELYCLGDVIAVKVMRHLLNRGMSRQVVARVGEELPLDPEVDDAYRLFRVLADFRPGQWFHIPQSVELIEPGGSVFAIFLEDHVTELIATDDWVCRDGDLVWYGPPGEHLGLFLPISSIAAEVVELADQWRRQHRIPEKRWAPWL